MGTLVAEIGHWFQGIHIPKVEAGEGHVEVKFESLNLVPGQYSISLWITGSSGNRIYDGDVRATLEVEPADVYGAGHMLSSNNGLVYFAQQWNVERAR
jgi:hypothetical protein